MTKRRRKHPCKALHDWDEQPPNSIHAYRVTCTKCRSFIKWGTRDSLADAKALRQVRHVVKFEVPATLEAWLD